MIKNVRYVELNMYCNCFPEYKNFKDNLTQYKCLCCNKNYQNKFDEKLKERFLNTYRFSNHDKNKFILLLQMYIWMNGNI